MHEPNKSNATVPNSSSTPLVRCSVCNCLTKRLSKHMKKAHANPQLKSETSEDTSQKSKNSNICFCPICQCKLRSNRLDRHIAKAHPVILESERRDILERELFLAAEGIASTTMKSREDSIASILRMTTAPNAIKILRHTNGIAEKLVAAIKSTPQYSQAIARLVLFIGPTCLPALLNAKFEMSSIELARALDLIRQLAISHDSVTTMLCKVSKHRDPEVRFRATFVLAHLGSKVAHDAVAARRNDSDLRIRKLAIRQPVPEAKEQPTALPQLSHVSPAGRDMSGDTHDLEFYDPDHGH